jgi:hypothetical protein
LKPLDVSKWTLVKKAIVDHAGGPSTKKRSDAKSESLAASEELAAGSDEASFVSVGGPSSKTELSEKDEDLGTVVDARREIRAKLYFGKVCVFFSSLTKTLHDVGPDTDGLVLVHPSFPSVPDGFVDYVEIEAEGGRLSPGSRRVACRS